MTRQDGKALERGILLALISLMLVTGAALAIAAGRAPDSGSESSPRKLVAPKTYGKTCRVEPQVCFCRDDRACLKGSVPKPLRRPLQLASPETIAQCESPTRGGEAAYPGLRGVQLGDGPVVPLVVPQSKANRDLATKGILVMRKREYRPGEERPGGWHEMKTAWVSKAEYRGPVLMRAGRIDGGGPLAFGERPTSSSRQIPPARWSSINGERGYRNWPGGTFVRKPGCYGWQIDGLDFSTVIVFRARFR